MCHYLSPGNVYPASNFVSSSASARSHCLGVASLSRADLSFPFLPSSRSRMSEHCSPDAVARAGLPFHPSFAGRSPTSQSLPSFRSSWSSSDVEWNGSRRARSRLDLLFSSGELTERRLGASRGPHSRRQTVRKRYYVNTKSHTNSLDDLPAATRRLLDQTFGLHGRQEGHQLVRRAAFVRRHEHVERPVNACEREGAEVGELRRTRSARSSESRADAIPFR